MANGLFGGGDGTIESPYIVEDAQDLNAVRNNLSACYLQSQNIDLSEYSNWVPIAAPTSVFAGVYDGGNYWIKNVYCAPSEENFYNGVGLFCDIWMAEVKNIKLEGTFVGNSRNDNVGGLSGKIGSPNNESLTQITNCYIQATVISSGWYAGGIAGYGYGALLISNCSSISNITANSVAGGLFGQFTFGSITNCFSMSTINSNVHDAGGLIGYTGGILCAGCTDPWSYPPTITNCYSASTLNGSATNKGGLIGSVYPVSYIPPGGVRIDQDTVCTNSYFDSTISGIISASYGTPKTTEEMIDILTYIDWDFETIWGINKNINSGYPFLIVFIEYTHGVGSIENPYQIWSYEDLYNVRFFPSSFFIQMSNINMLDTGPWEPIDIKNINYNGNNKSIKNMVIILNDERSSIAGLFGDVWGIVAIYDLKIINGTIIGSENSSGEFGFIVGMAYSYDIEATSLNIFNCIAVGKIIAYDDYNIGGIAGYINDYIDVCNINNCYARISVEILGEASSIGGIVGYLNKGQIINCKTKVEIISEDTFDKYSYQVGGIVGSGLLLEIEECSSSGKIVASDEVGGIIGTIFNSTFYQDELEYSNIVRNCYSDCELYTNYGYVGGIIGRDESEYNICFEKNYFNGKISGKGEYWEEYWDEAHGLIGCSSNLMGETVLLENDKAYIIGDYLNKIVETDLNFEIIREAMIDGESLDKEAIIKNGFIYIKNPLRKIRISDFTVVAECADDRFSYRGERNMVATENFLYISFLDFSRNIILYKVDINTLEILESSIIKSFASGSYNVKRVLYSDDYIHIYVYKSYDTHYLFAVDTETMTLVSERMFNNRTDSAAYSVDICDDGNYIYAAPVWTTRIRRYTRDLSSYVETGNFPDTIRHILTDGSYLYVFARTGPNVIHQRLYKIEVPSLTFLVNEPNTTNGKGGYKYYNNHIYTLLNTRDVSLKKISTSDFSSFERSHYIYKDLIGGFYLEKCVTNIPPPSESTLFVGTAKSLEELKNPLTYSDWNFDTIWNMDENINSGFPYLRNAYPISPFPDGSFTRGITDNNYLYSVKTSFVEKGIRGYLSRIEKRDLSTLEIINASDFFPFRINGPINVDNRYIYVPVISFYKYYSNYYHSNTKILKINKNTLIIEEETEEMFYSSGSDTDISDIIIDNNNIFSTAILSQGFSNLQSFNKYNMFPNNTRSPSISIKEKELLIKEDALYGLSMNNVFYKIDPSTLIEIERTSLDSAKHNVAINNDSVYFTANGEVEGIKIEQRDLSLLTPNIENETNIENEEYSRKIVINEREDILYTEDEKFLFCTGEGTIYNKIFKISCEDGSIISSSNPLDETPAEVLSLETDGRYLYALNANDNIIKIDCVTLQVVGSSHLEKEDGEVLNRLLYGERYLYLISTCIRDPSMFDSIYQWQVRKIDPASLNYILTPETPDSAGEPFKDVFYYRGSIHGIEMKDPIRGMNLSRIKTSPLLFDSAMNLASSNEPVCITVMDDYIYCIMTNGEVFSAKEFIWGEHTFFTLYIPTSENSKIFSEGKDLYMTNSGDGILYLLKANNGALDSIYKEENLSYNIDILNGDKESIYVTAIDGTGTVNRLLEYRRKDLNLIKEMNIENSKITHCISLNLAIG